MVGSEGSSLADGAGSSVAREPTGPAGSGSACWVIRHVRVRAEMNAGDGRLRFKDDAANFGNSRCRVPGRVFLPKLLLNRVLAIIVRLPAGQDAVAGVVAGPHRIAVSRHNPPQTQPWRPVPQTVARCQRPGRVRSGLSQLSYTGASGCAFTRDPHDSCVRPIRPR